MLNSKIKSKCREQKKVSAFSPRPLAFSLQPSAFSPSAFTLVEMLVTLVLMSLIVLALMAVFNSTQQAFRSSLTQTDILESGRNVMGMMTADLETMTPSDGAAYTNGLPAFFNPVNFYANTNRGYAPLVQALPASPTGAQRTNVLESFFILSRQNVNGTPSWVGDGYTVVTNSPSGLYSLYRFTTNAPVAAVNPYALFSAFSQSFLQYPTNYSHVLDGVVDLTVTPYDPNGLAMTNSPWYSRYNGQTITHYYPNTLFLPQFVPGAAGFFMYSNTVPASVEVELGVLENATLKHAEGLPSYEAQTNYLFNHVGQVHLFRQRVWIRNVNPAAYPSQ